MFLKGEGGYLDRELYPFNASGVRIVAYSRDGEMV
jgi:hypothetical protein